MDNLSYKLNKKSLAIFFTLKGKSLEEWKKIGILEREILLYFELAKYFKNLVIFTYGSKKDLEIAKDFPLNIKVIPNNTFLPKILYSFLLPLIHRKLLKNTDILKTNQMDGSWTAVIAKKWFKNKLIVRCGYEWLNFLERGHRQRWKIIFAKLAERFAYNNADKIVITTEEDKSFILNRFKIKNEKVEVIPNYIDTNLFKPLGILKEKNRILFLGRFEKQKNVISLMNAMSGISAELVMIGKGSQLKELHDIAKKNNIRVNFLGNIKQREIPLELNKSEIFIFPSLYEGNPKALLEAMSCGVACIGARSPGINNIIMDGENGILCEVDSESIKEKIKYVLGDKNLRDKIGLTARKTVLDNFSLIKVLEKEIGLYESLHEKYI